MVPKGAHSSLGQTTSLWSRALQAEEGKYIDQIPTLWTAVERMPVDRSARQLLLLRYYGAVYRYLRAVLHDPETAGDLAQEFAERFLRGRFNHADRRRGRFRDYVKAAVRNLIADRYRRSPSSESLHGDVPEPGAPDKFAEDDRQFLDSWRDQLLTHAWEELARLQDRTGQPFHAVLRFRVDHPDLNSSRMAEQLSARLGKPVSAGWVRQMLFRARKRFNDSLLCDIVHSLGCPTAELLEQELIDLGLWDYCRETLDEWRGRRS
jgi:RNA polymerase sigma factor (sigma-70 family)